MTAIESHRSEEKIEGSSDRSFGLVFAAFFAIIACLPWLRGGEFRFWAFAVSGAFFMIALLYPSILSSLNRYWMKLGLILSRIVSPIALGILFCFTIVPIGLLMRVLGKDPLRLKLDPAASSYWILRTPPGPDPKSMDNQF